ncbi:hypothetical protein M406DRAFT_329250 [Cryphonectria parasitica EP155]|uniref:Uncharacterized protein n=1 Tax=Cryphonectria parasitica (strain ATCC 38755 / EP155) TaxID=660469 RepID=A0A9P5CPM5_CRYP1|nr:uncharacterized protein M406DRAFT_329250 [Cryphonectria parasitica EP155]KAF3765336.1 hypothetical protein M406DRAFT_329250 [Cryphonectria parasitica EP155]
MAQLPEGARGAAVAILVYSFLCLFCNILMLWLLWTSRQTFSHIGLICIATLFCVCANIAQQINDHLYWRDVMTARFLNIKATEGNPMLIASNGYTGLDLYLWSIRYCSETIAAGLGCFWANWVMVNRFGKVISIILPIIFMILCHLDAVQQSEALFFFLLDVLFFGFVAGGAAGLLAILVKYIKIRRELKSWEVATVFELDTVIIQITGQKSIDAEAARLLPDLSTSHAKSIFALFIPSAFASLLALFTFGTTKHFRDTIYRTFVPKRWQRRPVERELMTSPPPPPPPAPASAQDWNLSTGELGRRFGDRGSWADGIRHVSGGIALQELRHPREHGTARNRGSSRNSALRDNGILQGQLADGGGGAQAAASERKESPTTISQGARHPTTRMNETTYPI